MRIFFTISLLSLTLCNGIFAQLDNGTIFPTNVVGQDVISNQTIDVQSWLDDDKVVILNFFASWSKQSWEYYESGWLKNLNDEFGPDGTDEIRIIAIEAEPLNGPEQLSMENDEVRPMKSHGDWIRQVNFPILDDASYNLDFSVDLLPITYVIRPNGSMIELNRNGALVDRAFQMKAIFPKEKDVILNSNIRDGSFCGEFTIPEGQVTVLNMGQETIENMTLDFYVGNSIVQSIRIDEAVGQLSTYLIDTEPQLLNSDAEVNIFISNINDIDYPIDNYNLITAEVIEPVLNTEFLKMKITFDKYPNEAQWILKSDTGEIIATEEYSTADIDPYATVEYDIAIPQEVNCLNLVVQDNYGDGWTKWGIDEDGNATPVPGIQFYNQFDVLLKDKHNVENSSNFKVDLEVLNLYIRRDMISSNVEVDNTIDVDIYPIPASDYVNIKGIDQINNLVEVQVLDNIGKRIHTYNNIQNQAINVAELTGGIYYLKIVTEQKSVVKAFIKE